MCSFVVITNMMNPVCRVFAVNLWAVNYLSSVPLRNRLCLPVFRTSAVFSLNVFCRSFDPVYRDFRRFQVICNKIKRIIISFTFFKPSRCSLHLCCFLINYYNVLFSLILISTGIYFCNVFIYF